MDVDISHAIDGANFELSHAYHYLQNLSTHLGGHPTSEDRANITPTPNDVTDVPQQQVAELDRAQHALDDATAALGGLRNHMDLRSVTHAKDRLATAIASYNETEASNGSRTPVAKN